jgi:glycosyltransferase involved in cell wall biosynthesis
MVEEQLAVDLPQQSLAGKKVVIVKSYYPIEKDTRLIKLLGMLKGLNLEITFLGWDRSSTPFSSTNHLKDKSFKEIIMQRNAPYGPTSNLFLPLWWFFVFRHLMKLDWDLVHVINSPSITPAILAAKLKHKPVIYDIEDTTIDLLPFRGFIRSIGIHLERFHTKYVTAVILIDELQKEEFNGIPNKNCVVIYDSPPLHISNTDQIPMEKNSFKIFYAGYLNKEGHLNIESLLEAIKDIEDVTVKIAGEGNLVEEIKARASKTPDKIQYLGWISYNTVLKLSFNADLLFSLRDQYPLVHKYICGSKFLEALMCGKPILVNRGTSTATKVTDAKCGLIVDAHNTQEIREAISKLKHDKKLCANFALNSKKAYEQKYSWELMKRRLLVLYSKILNHN